MDDEVPIYESVCRDLGFRPARPIAVHGVTGQSANITQWVANDGTPLVVWETFSGKIVEPTRLSTA